MSFGAAGISGKLVFEVHVMVSWHLLCSILNSDRTAKIWDLGAGKEVVSLGGHPSSVVSVRYADKSGLVFTACQSIVKVSYCWCCYWWWFLSQLLALLCYAFFFPCCDFNGGLSGPVCVVGVLQ